MLSTVTKGMNYIGGRWAVATGETFEDRNPASTGELLGVFPRSGLQEVEGAVAAARAALQDWRRESRIREKCDFGVGYVNLPTIGAEVHLPFGGLKKSGTGCPRQPALLDAVTHRVSWTVNYGTDIKMAQGLKADLN